MKGLCRWEKQSGNFKHGVWRGGFDVVCSKRFILLEVLDELFGKPQGFLVVGVFIFPSVFRNQNLVGHIRTSGRDGDFENRSST